MTKIASPEDVAEQIRQDFRRLGYSVVEAAKLMRKSPQSLYNILKGKHRISPQNARAFGDCFNYSFYFLTKGEGQLRWDRSIDDVSESLNLGYSFSPAERARLSERERVLDDYMEILRSLNNALQSKHFPLGELRGISESDFPVKPRTVLEREIIFRIYFFAAGIEDYINLSHFFELFEKGEFWIPEPPRELPDYYYCKPEDDEE